MTIFRPCIDLHHGQVKQIVGSSLSEHVKTNFVSKESAAYYAELYKNYNLDGGHLIMLGSDHENIEAAGQVLQVYKGMQVGGGITLENATDWLQRGATKVIVTSYLFPEAKFSLQRLQQLSLKIGKEALVIDLSCKKVGNQHVVAMDKWKTLTDMVISKENLLITSQYCRYFMYLKNSEFLVHAADVEGLCNGIDEDLVWKLGQWSPIPVTYAGGGKSIQDLARVKELSCSKVDLTFGSALDIFGGVGVKLKDCVEWNAQNKEI